MLDPDHFQISICSSLDGISKDSWNSLLEDDSSPFVKHEFLKTLESTGCVDQDTGWQSAHILVHHQDELVGALPLYLKYHSYGEYVFDWAWANAYQQHGKAYYPKALSAIPFTPVQGSRLLSSAKFNQSDIQTMLIQGLKNLVEQNKLSSAHVLFPKHDEINALMKAGFSLRESVQFHWHNQGYEHFDEFLNALVLKRRKNIRRERERVREAGITFKHIDGIDSLASDWEFFYRCYQNTYVEHRSSPYLTFDFFIQLSQLMPNNLHLIMAYKSESPIAASLLLLDDQKRHAYGRYWGCMESIPLLHFETSYYQAIEFCIREKVQTLEGGAQGKHKMFRGFTPTRLQSAHYIQDPMFRTAINNFLERERTGMANYLNELDEIRIHKSSDKLSF